MRDLTPAPAARREWLALGVIVLLALLVRIAAIVLTQGGQLAGDQPEYDAAARLFADGHPFWGLAPTGEPHESLWKAPGYGLWLGLIYSLAGPSLPVVGVLQAIVSLVTVVLVWLIGRRLFNPGVGLAAALVAAVYPFAWIWVPTLYPEALAVPVCALIFYLVLGRTPTPARAGGVGALVGIALLIRPTSGFLLLGIAAAWVLASGWRRGAVLTRVSLACATVVIAPWTIRNYAISGAFVPLSVQDAAVYGTFNEESANDPDNPYAWRLVTPESREILSRRPLPSEVELRRALYSAAVEYVRAHPEAVPAAVFWNGIYRLWDLRPPALAMAEVRFEGRSPQGTAIGLAMYYLLLPLALIGLWRHRERRELWVPVLAFAVGATLVFSVAAGTRYRATLEPLVVVFACAAVACPLARAAEHLGTGRAPADG
jgi:4-amino-4-deoxy-L-arabinose transferase-like glycosyltransferase